MKHLKKFIVAALTMFVAFAMAIPAFAADTGTITVTNPVEGESYTLYKVFDATVASGRADEGAGIAYTSTWMKESNDYFDVDSKGYITITDAGKNADGNLSNEAIEWLKSQVSNFTKIGDSIVAGTVEWTGLADGYYYVDTTTGSFVTVDSITPNAHVQEKNTVPTVDKQQSATASDYANDRLDLNVGDIVYYSTVVNIGKGSDQEIVLTDVMTSGLTFDQDSIVVTDADGELSSDDYEVAEKSAQGYKLTLKEDYVKAHSEGVVTVTYTAKINENAVVDDVEGNDNTVTMKYSEQTTEDTVYVATYDFLLLKTDGNAYLPGAGFRLYASADGTDDEIKLSKDGTGYYLDAEGNEEILVDVAEGVNVRGLKPGTYYLEETTTPDGYNTLTARQPVTITAEATAPVEITVENNAGAELPSTGGMGTTILYIIGGILVVGGGIYLLTKKRMGKE